MEYTRPEEETGQIGPHKSTNTLSSGRVAFSPSLDFGTEECVCLLWMHASHFAGEQERSIIIPSAPSLRAMSTMAPTLQCPKQWCHVSTLGVRFAWKAPDGTALGEGPSAAVGSFHLWMDLTLDRDKLYSLRPSWTLPCKMVAPP